MAETVTWNVFNLSKDKAQCPVCGKYVRLLKLNRLWPHGPANRLCSGSWAERRQPTHSDGQITERTDDA